MKILTDSQLTSIMITIPSVNHRLSFDLHNLAVSRAMSEKDQKIAELTAEVERLKKGTQVNPSSETVETCTSPPQSASLQGGNEVNVIVAWLRRLIGNSTTVRALNTKKIADRIEAREYLSDVVEPE